MRAKGVSYSTGFVLRGENSRPQFDRELVAREMRVIRDDLHCTAVRVMGGDPERIEIAASLALELGLEVWFSPYPLELPADEILKLLADSAERAERLRERGGEIVFVAGAELSLMNPGFLPGSDTTERLAVLAKPDKVREAVSAASERVNRFLADAVAVVRSRFAGKLTYAAVPLDGVDWTLFDFVSMDLYRSSEIADRFVEGVRGLVAQGKPVAITEFGAASFRGASDLGGRGLEVVEYSPDTGRPLRVDRDLVRDELEQATCIRELLEIFDSGGIDSTFVFTFALTDFPHRPDGEPGDDLDLASYGLVRPLENGHGQTYVDMPWEPKVAFGTVGAYYGMTRHADPQSGESDSSRE